MMRLRFSHLLSANFIIIVFLCNVFAQGPRVSYYYNPATELSFASCYIYQQGGSQQKIPFLPVISRSFQRAPLGIANYNKDIHVEAPIVFIGNGIVKENIWNSYMGRRFDYTQGEINVAGKVVMFCYDFPDEIENQIKDEVPLEARIIEAASRKASAVVIFSHKTECPFLYTIYKNETDIPDIPVIAITQDSAINILYSSGYDGKEVLKNWEESGKPLSGELITRLSLKIKGNFDKVETDNFLIRFRKELISKDEIDQIAQINEKSIQFLFDVFKEEKELNWEKQLTVYFRDFDSKLFYTHHTGGGLASNEGVFNIFRKSEQDFGLAVHENTHRLTYLNWSDNSTSFLDEGVAKYTEALATEKDKNNLETIKYLKEGNLFPLEEMVHFNIGFPGLKTNVGYPASGSFAHFLIDTYGLKSFKEVFILEARSDTEKKKENSWEKAYGKPLTELEKEWLYWLGKRYNVEEKYIQNHLNKVKEIKEAQLRKKAIKMTPDQLKRYCGIYVEKEMGRKIEIKILGDRLILTSPDAPDFVVNLTPEEEHSFRAESGPTAGEVLVFAVDESGKATKVGFMSLTFQRE
jgi:hypothetical protein